MNRSASTISGAITVPKTDVDTLGQLEYVYRRGGVGSVVLVGWPVRIRVTRRREADDHVTYNWRATP